LSTIHFTAALKWQHTADLAAVATAAATAYSQYYCDHSDIPTACTTASYREKP